MLERILDFFLKNIEKLPTHAMWIMFFSVSSIVAFTYFFVKFPDFRAAIISLKPNAAHLPAKDVYKPADSLNSVLFASEPELHRAIASIHFDNEHKDWLFATILKQKVQYVIEQAQVFALDINPEADNLEFVKQSNEMLNCMILHYERAILLAFREKYKAYGEGCGDELFNYVYKNGFEPHHAANVDRIANLIQKVSISRVTLQFKVMTLFIQFYLALHEAVYDNVEVFDQFNGHIIEIIEKHRRAALTTISI